MFADHLLRRKTEPRLQPLRMIPIDELVAEFRIAVDYCDRSIVGDKAQFVLALAQPVYGLSKLRHVCAKKPVLANRQSNLSADVFNSSTAT
jgi:hypothetical protein